MENEMQDLLDQYKQENDVVEAVSGQGASETSNETTPEESNVTNQVDEASAQADAEVTTEETTTQAQPPVKEEVDAQTTTQESEPVFDWGRVSGLSEGLVKDEDSFKSILDRSKKYEELSKEAEELRAKKPANEFVGKLNDLILGGANEEQVKSFIELNNVDIKSLDPREALIQKAILMDGKPRALAEFEFKTSYNLNDYDEDSEDYLALQEKIKYDGGNAVKELEKYKADQSVVENTAAKEAEEARLAQVAETEKYNSLIAKESKKIASSFDSKMTINDGDKDHEVTFNDEFKSKMPDIIEDYFKNSREAINDESLAKVATHLENVYFTINRDSIVKDIKNKLKSELEEEFANKYENRGGINPDETNPNRNNGGQVVDSAQAVADIYGLSSY